MTTIVVMFFIGYVFHLLYKLLDLGFVFFSKLAKKVKPKKGES